MDESRKVIGESREPFWVGDVDIDDPPERLLVGRSPAGRPYRRARLLVRFRGEPVGMLTRPVFDGTVEVAALVAEAGDRFSREIALAADGVDLDANGVATAYGATLPGISVVIGTRNRADHVLACINRLLKQQYPGPFEVIVVENGSSDDSTRLALERDHGTDARIRFLADPRPGLSRARNLGLANARFSITAFLSDDIRVDDTWLLAVARGFTRSDQVRAVTGFCPPAYLDTPHQLMFEGLMAWGSRQGFTPELHGLGLIDDPLHPYRPGSFANGSVMAFDTDYLRSTGGFDELLGPGTACRGGEDLDAPIRVIVDGYHVAFEPAAFGWHADTFDGRPFHQHMYAYGLGLTAFLTKHFLDSKTRNLMVRRFLHATRELIDASTVRDTELSETFPIGRRNSLWHFVGKLAGPGTYLKARLLSSRHDVAGRQHQTDTGDRQ